MQFSNPNQTFIALKLALEIKMKAKFLIFLLTLMSEIQIKFDNLTFKMDTNIIYLFILARYVNYLLK